MLLSIRWRLRRPVLSVSSPPGPVSVPTLRGALAVSVPHPSPRAALLPQPVVALADPDAARRELDYRRAFACLYEPSAGGQTEIVQRTPLPKCKHPIVVGSDLATGGALPRVLAFPLLPTPLGFCCGNASPLGSLVLA
jgi:hypothetical protein